MSQGPGDKRRAAAAGAKHRAEESPAATSSSPACGPLGPRSTMKVLTAALAALLLVAICSLAEAHLDIVLICCFSYMQLPIPRRFITSAYRTSSKCAKPAVILVTNKGMELCADPQAPWVQAYLEHFQMLEY
ncbi:LOW QUALITY PROTEIN: C-C motif chemokine 3-like [Gymnogyps californianus]|uniref:LOW QUALITY PROTEIN: C-C motif chemokine 3-like n=1 Tax=Gymnogyps californianus TaxID=33616 RepID=UPI0021C5A399|nr:LOW QUALITY PROTEIN: C-C motif chemokine 3-like [Gymnogyps californianus]